MILFVFYLVQVKIFRFYEYPANLRIWADLLNHHILLGNPILSKQLLQELKLKNVEYLQDWNS